MNIETKLNIGDKVWAMNSNVPLEHTIENIEVTSYRNINIIKYIARRGESAGARAEFYEEDLNKGWYVSKQELINSL